MTPPNFSTAHGVEASGLHQRRASRLRNLLCEPDVLRPRPSPARARGRLIPTARPARGRSLWDPARQAIYNSAASRGGKLIKVRGHLIPRCDCCNDCPCPVPTYVGECGCGACTPRSWLAIADGISPGDCTNFFAAPPNEVWGKLLGEPNGQYCLTFNSDSLGLEGSLPGCSWGAYTGSSASFAWTASTCASPPSMCCDPPTDASYATTIALWLDGTNINCRIECHGSGVPGNRAESTVFYDSVGFDGCNKAYVFVNQVAVGDMGPAPVEIGIASGGTVTVTPCCG